MKHKEYRMSHVFYPTGLNLDYINGELEPPIPDGSISIIIGEAGIDKETLAVQIASNIIKEYKSSVVFHDGLSGSKHMFFENMDSKYIHRNIFDMSFENLYERVKLMHDNKIDRESNIKYYTGLADEGEKIYKYEPTVYILHLGGMKIADDVVSAKSRSIILQRVAKMCAEVNIILILINTIKTTEPSKSVRNFWPQIFTYLKQDESLLMGNSPAFLSNYMIRIDKVDEPECIDYYEIKVVKSFFESNLNYKLILEDGKYKELNKNE